MIVNRKSFGSLYDQSESADLDEIQFERVHARSHFCVDTAGLLYIFLLFFIYAILVITYSLITLRTPDKISRSISRVPAYVSKTNQTKLFSFNIDLKIVNLHHSPNFNSILNCSAAKTYNEEMPIDFAQELENENLKDYEDYQAIYCTDCLKTSIKSENNDVYFQFNITEKHRLFNRDSVFEEYSKEIFKSIVAKFPKDSLYSSEFNIFSLLFNDPDYFSVEKDPNNYIYSEHSALNSPSLSSTFTIQTNFTNFNALDFIYYYANPIMKKYFKTLQQIFSYFVLLTLSINVFYTKHQISKFTRIFVIVLSILGVLATNPFENIIDNFCAQSHQISLNMNDDLNDASLRIGIFSFSLFINALRFFFCIQFCFICCHSFSTMFRTPNSFVTFGLATFYLIFTLVDYKAQYHHETNLFRYSSLSYSNRDILVLEQNKKLKYVSYDSSLYSSSAMESQNAPIPPLKIEIIRMFFVLIHFCFTLWLIKTSLSKVNDGADPHPNAENDRLKALIFFSLIPNIAAILVHCYFVYFSILQRKIFPEIVILASNEFCVAAILLLFRGVEDDVEDDTFQRFYKLGKHSDFDQRSFEIND